MAALGLAQRLGSQALALAVGSQQEQLQPLEEGFGLTEAEVKYHLRWSQVVHLADWLLRRVRLGMWQPRQCWELAPALRRVVRPAAGWSVARWQQELALLHQELRQRWPPEESP
ncbi:MAG: hypothetical protein NZ869_05895 [Thermoanaerobaculum sp.]|nr:hypothetical protein [Thermoanaerobaculum sp.]MDW7967657.1 glycerol-3-phosphate dehydrogenase C-terminal domain-containing protein [Thermoanaerobaculum sp.]